MSSTIIVAIISFAGTLIGTAGGILAAGKLTAFRLEQLETKLDNQSRTVAKIPVIEEKINNMNHRIRILEKDSGGLHSDFDGC